MPDFTAIAEAARRVVEAEKLVSEAHETAMIAPNKSSKRIAVRMLVKAENACSDADEALKTLTPASVVLEMAEALAVLGEFDRRVRRDLGEAVHTGLRKGADSDQASKAWEAIRTMPPGDWSNAIAFARSGLESGIETKLREARRILGGTA
jgi:hypothetical protein